MASPERPKAGKPHLRRDNQKWVYDWVVKETGKVFHFQSDGRGRLPPSVRKKAWAVWPPLPIGALDPEVRPAGQVHPSSSILNRKGDPSRAFQTPKEAKEGRYVLRLAGVRVTMQSGVRQGQRGRTRSR